MPPATGHRAAGDRTRTTSPFNQRIPANPRLASRSNEIVNRLLGFGPLQHLEIGLPDSRDYEHPTVYSRASDPLYTIHCKTYACTSIEGDAVRIPADDRPAGGSDGSLTVIDQTGQSEIDLWRVPRGRVADNAVNGVLTVASGGRTPIGTFGSNGLLSPPDSFGAGNAPRTGLLGGMIRGPEMQAAQINHALYVVAYCDSASYVYPASKGGRSCSSVGRSNSDAPPMGTRLQLDPAYATEGWINSQPSWKRPMLRAMRDYGMYVLDTGTGSWALRIEGQTTYTAFGNQDPWFTFARDRHAAGDAQIALYQGYYVLQTRSGVDFANGHLRVVDPCVTQGTC